MQAAAASPEAAQTLGFSPGRARSAAFVIAALGTGLAGVLYVPVVGFLSPSLFHVELSIFFFSVIVCGRGRLLGPIAGVWVLYLVPNVLPIDRNVMTPPPGMWMRPDTFRFKVLPVLEIRATIVRVCPAPVPPWMLS